jgi:hypothetical protein
MRVASKLRQSQQTCANVLDDASRRVLAIVAGGIFDGQNDLSGDHRTVQFDLIWLCLHRRPSHAKRHRRLSYHLTIEGTHRVKGTIEIQQDLARRKARQPGLQMIVGAAKSQGVEAESSNRNSG